jgi:hypothetical protein
MNDDTKVGHVPQAKYRVVVNANGISLQSRWRGNASGGNHGKRGKVEGFSKASARRFRHLLFSVDYSHAVAVTLTHPIMLDGMRGPEAAFEAIRSNSCRMPWLKSLIWRKEVTRAGMPHYHVVLFPVDDVAPLDAADALIASWIDACLDCWALPKGLEAVRDKYRADMYEAHGKRAVKVMDGSCYVRYLLDHQSKHKVEQAHTSGRPWGVWNRVALPLVPGLSDDFDSDAQYWAYSRILRKASRYLIKADCVFGRRHSRGRRASGIGKVDYFALKIDGAFGALVKQFVMENYQ